MTVTIWSLLGGRPACLHPTWRLRGLLQVGPRERGNEPCLLAGMHHPGGGGCLYLRPGGLMQPVLGTSRDLGGEVGGGV